MVPRKIPGAETAKCAHHVCDGEVAIDDFVGHGLLKIPMPSGLVEQSQLLVFHQERLCVIHAELFRECVKILEVGKELMARF